MNKVFASQAAVVLALGLLVTGCGKDDKPRPPRPRSEIGQLTGKLSIKGRLLGGGSIKLYDADGTQLVIAPIKPDGTYEIDGVPTGKVTVTIETKTALDLMPTGTANVKPPWSSKIKYVEIPERYGDPKKSGLTVTVKAGKQPKDFDLADK